MNATLFRFKFDKKKNSVKIFEIDFRANSYYYFEEKYKNRVIVKSYELLINKNNKKSEKEKYH